MLVIGNGESRKGINIDLLAGPKIGCNAIYRDFKVQHLVCVDKRMMSEVIDAGVNNDSLIYTRKDWYSQFNLKRIRTVPRLPYAGMDRPDNPIHWGSGPYAVLLGALKSKERNIRMIGFDLYSSDNKINNIYKSTKNYEAAEKSAIDPRYWIYQIGKVFECFPLVNFTVYQEDDWKMPKSWKHPHVKVDKLENI